MACSSCEQCYKKDQLKPMSSGNWQVGTKENNFSVIFYQIVFFLCRELNAQVVDSDIEALVKEFRFL